MVSKKDIQEISKKLNIPVEKVEKMLKEVFESISKPSLDNIDCPHYEVGIGSSDEIK